MKTIISLITTVLFAHSGLLVAQEDSSRSSLDYYSQMYKSYEHKKFDLGGEPSRFAWFETPGLFPHTTIAHNNTRILPVDLNTSVQDWSVSVDGKALSFNDYVSQEQRIDSVMILHKGRIIYQRYKTHGPLDRHLTWSVTKVFTSTALARLEAMGKVNMQAPVKTYLPDFAQSAWADIALQDVIDMSSGIDCRDSDGYQNTDACVYKAEEALGVVPQVRDTLTTYREFLKTVGSHRAAGEETEYTSSNTNIAGMVIEAVTEKPIARAFSELLWQAMGAEADGLMLINQYGEAYSSGGISARLADIARFGLLFLENDERWLSIDKSHREALKNKPRPLLSKARLQTLSGVFDGDTPLHSSWQWDLIWKDGDMFKGGYSGQGVYVSPTNDMVMVWFGTADYEFQTHSLLQMARKLSQSDVLKTE